MAIRVPPGHTWPAIFPWLYKTKYGAMIAFGGAVTTVVLNILLVPKYGYTGAAWAHLACYFSMVVFSFIGGRKFYKINYDFRNIFLYFTIAFGLYFLSEKVSFEEGALKYLVHFAYITLFVVIAFLLEKRKYYTKFR